MEEKELFTPKATLLDTTDVEVTPDDTRTSAKKIEIYVANTADLVDLTNLSKKSVQICGIIDAIHTMECHMCSNEDMEYMITQSDVVEFLKNYRHIYLLSTDGTIISGTEIKNSHSEVTPITKPITFSQRFTNMNYFMFVKRVN